MRIEKLGVVGAGQMGAGIAHVAALASRSVTLVDLSDELVARGRKTIEKNLGRMVEKGKVTPEARDAALARLATGTDVGLLADADLVVEAVVEDEALKLDLFRRLDRTVKAGSILASNTSSISITRLAAATSRPESFIGMHFMNPVPVMQLVEVIRGIATSDETAAVVVETARDLGKTPVECRDYPGFVSNRVLMPMINEAVYAVFEGVATPDAVDTIMRLGMNHPMGPLTLADFIGLDTCLAILRVLHRGLGDDKYRPCPLLVQMVDAGWLGKKSGRGFHRYAGPGGERLPS
ncbi:3-hydroxybutyryl-CoA dehydrogenase [Acidobacteria bacterium ACD]|nr:MAG: 3-hydroxybutyryl-CoA dehydrogenase [Acidobacteriota bacterium]MCE7958961.1 3-hydroxybutyryl-CoA dehydrogenase [Acidobacteria bacterium ACB2]MDL1950657.1 3-hydroxybutyryl-CoA dehydrogenase [Acidobacteria bacterium ACD]